MSDTNTLPAKGGTEESAAEFRAALEEIGETQAGLVRIMIRHGDDRSAETIRRNIQRMASGEARVSGEMRVVLDFLRRGRRKTADAVTSYQWEVAENGTVSTSTSDGWDIYLHPMTGGRYRVLVQRPASNFAMPYPPWQPTLEKAQSIAMTLLQEGRHELEEWMRETKERANAPR